MYSIVNCSIDGIYSSLFTLKWNDDHGALLWMQHCMEFQPLACQAVLILLPSSSTLFSSHSSSLWLCDDVVQFTPIRQPLLPAQSRPIYLSRDIDGPTLTANNDDQRCRCRPSFSGVTRSNKLGWIIRSEVWVRESPSQSWVG